MRFSFEFEHLARSLTGVRCEPTRLGVGTRVILGIVCTTLVYGLGLAFGGLFSNPSISVILIYSCYITASLLCWFKGWTQLAQYLAWAPLLVIGVGLIIAFSVAPFVVR
jgi:hypothetical protein